MYCSYDYGNGLPPRLYRTPGEIRRDILSIVSKINEVNYMLNIRNVISSVIIESEESDYKSRIEAASEVIEYSAEALEKLKAFKLSVEELRDELCESIAACNAG